MCTECKSNAIAIRRCNLSPQMDCIAKLTRNLCAVHYRRRYCEMQALLPEKRESGGVKVEKSKWCSIRVKLPPVLFKRYNKMYKFRKSGSSATGWALFIKHTHTFRTHLMRFELNWTNGKRSAGKSAMTKCILLLHLICRAVPSPFSLSLSLARYRRF